MSVEAQRSASVDRGIAAAIAGGAFVLYALTACPTVYTEDAAEFSTAAAVFGVPHPPGYPLYTLLAAFFVRAVPFGASAYRSNLFSAACGAAALAVVWMFLRRLQRERVVATAAVACLAFGDTFWSQCVVAEVHALNCLLLAVALLAAVVAREKRTNRAFAVCGAAVGLWVGHRNMNVIFLPAFIVMLVPLAPLALSRAAHGSRTGAAEAHTEARAQLRLFGWAAVGALATALVYLYLPLAARRDPPLNIGAPTTWSRFYAVLSAQSYFRHFGTGDVLGDLARVWTFIRRLPADVGVAAVAAPVGFVFWNRKDAGTNAGRALPLALLLLLAACVAFSALYNVMDVTVYFLPAHLVIVVAAAFACPAFPPKKTVGAKLVRVAVVAIALLGFPLSLKANDLRHMRVAQTYADDLLRSAPPGTLLVSFGDTADHVLGYAQAVAHQRADVVVVHANQLTPWYTEQLRRHASAVRWPGEEVALDDGWLRALAILNLPERPICLTHPLPLEIEGATAAPHGLLTCWRESAEGAVEGRTANNRNALDECVALWGELTPPRRAALARVDVHVRMIAFAYASARFALARSLVMQGEEAKARAQLQAVLTMDPDHQEREIAAALKTIGRQQRRPFAYGQRATQALALPAGDIVALRAAILGGP